MVHYELGVGGRGGGEGGGEGGGGLGVGLDADVQGGGWQAAGVCGDYAF